MGPLKRAAAAGAAVDGVRGMGDMKPAACDKVNARLHNRDSHAF